MLLVGDVGGTKTDLGIYSGGSDARSPIVRKEFHNADYKSLQAIVMEFLADTKLPVTEATFDVAGPVIDKSAVITNLSWAMDEESLARTLNLKSVHLINDLEAVARSIPVLREDDVVTLNIGEPVHRTTIAIIAPGTGLGQSFLAWNGSSYTAHSSEGGHSDFAPADRRQIRLLEYLLDRFNHVSMERVCSGIGIPNIYQYLRDVENLSDAPETAEQIASATDPTKVIVNAAIDPHRQSPLCRATIDMFASILASEAGNLALKVLSTGGVYLAGGVAAHTLPVLQDPAFMRAFTQKGRFSEFMKRIPVHVIVTNAALIGAAHYALQTDVKK